MREVGERTENVRGILAAPPPKLPPLSNKGLIFGLIKGNG